MQHTKLAREKTKHTTKYTLNNKQHATSSKHKLNKTNNNYYTTTPTTSTHLSTFRREQVIDAEISDADEAVVFVGTPTSLVEDLNTHLALGGARAFVECAFDEHCKVFLPHWMS
jgi:alkanesulfonate monooxygenase SsuD/methylene tetrahydromethanopterin reductase-like flavin-dependent oxidoreductase (luciferase family)